MSESNRRVRVVVSGRVQGVFFRASTRDHALHLGASGWVRNMTDGRVEAVFEGSDEQVEKMLSWCHRGSPLSRVDGLEIEEENPENIEGFQVFR